MLFYDTNLFFNPFNVSDKDSRFFKKSFGYAKQCKILSTNHHYTDIRVTSDMRMHQLSPFESVKNFEKYFRICIYFLCVRANE